MPERTTALLKKAASAAAAAVRYNAAYEAEAAADFTARATRIERARRVNSAQAEANADAAAAAVARCEPAPPPARMSGRRGQAVVGRAETDSGGRHAEAPTPHAAPRRRASVERSRAQRRALSAEPDPRYTEERIAFSCAASSHKSRSASFQA